MISAAQEIVGELSFETYGYPAIPKCYALLDMDALNETGISTVQNYPALQLDGKGIMIGLVDTGIDYTNEIFRNPDGTTRIAGLDDSAGRRAAGRISSTAVNTRQETINAARLWILRTPSPGLGNSHGTFLASIAGGSRVNGRDSQGPRLGWNFRGRQAEGSQGLSEGVLCHPARRRLLSGK